MPPRVVDAMPPRVVDTMPPRVVDTMPPRVVDTMPPRCPGCGGGRFVLKLKAARFALRTRSARLSSPTILPGRLFDLARSLLAKEANGIDFRLTGIGASLLVPGSTADLGDWAGLTTPRRAAAQAAIDALRGRFGESAISRVRSLR
jgi:DNA polymerase IV